MKCLSIRKPIPELSQTDNGVQQLRSQRQSSGACCQRLAANNIAFMQHSDVSLPCRAMLCFCCAVPQSYDGRQPIPPPGNRKPATSSFTLGFDASPNFKNDARLMVYPFPWYELPAHSVYSTSVSLSLIFSEVDFGIKWYTPG